MLPEFQEYSLSAIDLEKEEITFSTLRSNGNKRFRELWCLKRFCEICNWTDAVLCYPIEDRGIDVHVRYSDNYYDFQITEIAPRDKKVLFKFSKPLEGMPFADLKEEIEEVVSEAVNNKVKKSYSDSENLNLLIYLNGPHGIVIDSDLDIGVDNIKSKHQNQPDFKTISLLTNDSKVIFIKGSKDIL